LRSDTFLILFIVFIAIMTLWPLLLRRFQIPGVIALLIAGMLIGPNCLDLVRMLADTFSFLGGKTDVVVQNFDSLISSFGSLGLVFLMALAGMEADFKLINSARKPVAALSILTFLLPAVAGYYVYSYFRPDDFPGKLLYASLFASHSVGIVFPVIRELKLTKTRFGASVLISTVITDIASIILLAVSGPMTRQAPRGGSFPCFAEPEERHASVRFRISTPSAMMKPVLEPVFPVRSTDLAERTWPITSDCLR